MCKAYMCDWEEKFSTIHQKFMNYVLFSGYLIVQWYGGDYKEVSFS